MKFAMPKNASEPVTCNNIHSESDKDKLIKTASGSYDLNDSIIVSGLSVHVE